MRNVVLILLKLTVIISLIVTVASVIGLMGVAWAMFGGIALLISLPVWVMAKVFLSPRKENTGFINS